MKHFIMAMALIMPRATGNRENINEQLVTEVTVGELRRIIRGLINQTREGCITEGVMWG